MAEVNKDGNGTEGGEKKDWDMNMITEKNHKETNSWESKDHNTY